VHLGFGLLTLFPGRVGGTETYVRDLLVQFVRGNGPEQVTVLANRHVEQAYATRMGGPVRLHRVRSYRAGDTNLTRALAMAGAWLAPRRAARDVPGGLDVLHLPVTVPIPSLDLPTVVTIHEVQYHAHPEFFSRAERRYRRWAYDGSARAADVVVAVSRYVADRLVDTVGVDPEAVEVVYYGIDHERFRPGPVPGDEAADALELPERFVFYPANAWPHKNHERLIEALAICRDRSLHLVLAGQDYGRLPELHRHTRRAGVADRVHHLGQLDFPLLAAVMRRARALVYPSLHEGFGMPPVEAMACGLPAASAMNTSLPEACGGAALELDPLDPEAMAEAIERIDSDEPLREQLRAAGLQHAARFTWSAAAERHKAIYERAYATRASQAGSYR
jgi:glycosyltransferase involved in cell wall biosynthesis